MKNRILFFALMICLLTGCSLSPTHTPQQPSMPEKIDQVSTTVSATIEEDHVPTEPTTSLETTVCIASTTVEKTTVATTPPTEDVPTETIEQVIPESEPVSTEPPTETVLVPEETEDPTVQTEETEPEEEVIPPTETTEPTIAGLDCEAAMNVGNQYGAATYSWIVDLSLNESNAGFNFGSWVFAEDGQAVLDANKNLITTLKTDSDGYVYSGLLLPGTYYVREVHDRDETYWTYDATVEQKVTVTAGAQAQVGYTNTQYGRMEFRKTTNTGNHLSGWTFRVTDSEGNLVGDYVTDANGYAVTGKLAPGRYYVQELSSNDSYWICDVETRTVDVTAGRTVGNTWNNIERGKGTFRKTTNTGKDLDGWYITV